MNNVYYSAREIIDSATDSKVHSSEYDSFSGGSDYFDKPITE